MEDKCVVCGSYVPEGRQICPSCEIKNTTKKNIITEFRNITEDIAICRSKITSLEREINKLTDSFKPDGVKAVNYESTKVISSHIVEDAVVVAKNIVNAQIWLRFYNNELNELYKQRDDLEATINSLGLINKKIIMLRIKGWPAWKIAKETNYSKRRIEQIVKSFNE